MVTQSTKLLSLPVYVTLLIGAAGCAPHVAEPSTTSTLGASWRPSDTPVVERHAESEASGATDKPRLTPTDGASLVSAAPPSAAEAAAPTDPAFANRRAVEALDRVAFILHITDDKRGKLITLSTDDLFEPGGTSLATFDKSRLDQIAWALKLQGDRPVTITGFTDDLGDAAENRDLSQRRASALRDYLVSKGVDGSHLQVVGMGPSRPKESNATSDGRAANRRIEILIDTTHQEPRAAAKT